MSDVWIFTIILSSTAIVITISKLLYDINKSKQENKDIWNRTDVVCKKLKEILNDVDLSEDSEEPYEVDLSLQSYFEESRGEIIDLIKDLRALRTGVLHKTDKRAVAFGNVLEWTIKEFYRADYEEEERIRIWTKNMPEFHSRITELFNMKQ